MRSETPKILRAYDQDEIEYIQPYRNLDTNLQAGTNDDVYFREVEFTDKSVGEALNDGSVSIDDLMKMFGRQ